MITSWMRIDGTLRSDVSAEGMRSALADTGALLWVDIEETERGDGEALLRDVFGFHPLTIDDCYNTLIDPPKVDDYGDYLFVIIHNVRYDASTRTLTTSELDMYVGRNYVVSFHKQPVNAVDELRRRLTQNTAAVTERDADFLAHTLFDVVVDDFQPIVEQLDDAIDEIEGRVIDRPEKQQLHDVLALRRDAQRLRRTVMPQRDVAARFARGDYADVIGRDSLMYFRDIYDHTVRVEEMIEAVRDLADNTLNTYLGAVNNRTNEVMKTLAIVTAIFLPLTLIAGVYGTNFDNVPEYELRFGYAGMLIAMLVVAAALIAWFRWRRWI